MARLVVWPSLEHRILPLPACLVLPVVPPYLPACLHTVEETSNHLSPVPGLRTPQRVGGLRKVVKGEV